MVYYKEFVFPSTVPIVKGSQGTFVNVPCSFDIETSSWYYRNEKVANMYIWQFGFDNTAVYGKTWEELKDWFDMLHIFLSLNDGYKLIVYVHNLGYEFQFLKGHFTIEKLFAREKRRPMYFSIGQLLFKDSLILSGLSLDKTLKECNSEHLKTDGLDYSKLRHSETPLTDEELEYCENDVLGLNDFIRKEMNKNGDISKIPTTKTGYVRRYVRNKCLSNPKYGTELREQLTTDPKIFDLMRKCFSGAYTHGNNTKIGIVCEDVGSYDFTSSYPAVMLRHKYPCSRFNRLTIIGANDLIELSTKYCTLIHATLYKLRATNSIHPLSKHKCHYDTESLIEDNGKIVRSDVVEVFLTGIDFLDLRKCYEYESIQVHDFYYAQKDYLPKEIINCILDFYVGKTTLKGIEEKKEEYLVSKGMLNAIYGMMVTNPIAPKVEFNDNLKEWEVNDSDMDLQKELVKIIANKKTFLNYAWGIFVTAYARHELYDGILTTIKDDDFIYADTDSMKILNYHKYDKYISDYNFRVVCEINACLDHYGIDRSRANPTGDAQIGIWDFEGTYEQFKTLGAKRYAYVKNGEFKFTVSGLPNKKSKSGLDAINWICKDNGTHRYGMDYFNNKMHIPATHSNKLTHTYIDKDFECIMTDYLGNKCYVHEYSYVHLEPQEFTLNFSEVFLNYLLGIDQPQNGILEDIFSGKVGGIPTYE